MRKFFKPISLLIIFLLIFSNTIHSRELLVYDFNTKTNLYYEGNEETVAIASLSKLMTAYLVLDALKEHKIFKGDVLTYTSEEKALYGSDVLLKEGHTITVDEALNLMLVGSANSCALLLAKHVARTEKEFVKMMNEKAREMGMQNTHFINSHGLPIISTDEQNMSTMGDLVKLVDKLLTDFPEVLEITSKEKYSLERYVITLSNTNPLLAYRNADGLKTGTTTKAGKCLILTSTEPIDKSDQKRRVVVFVLGETTNEGRINSAKRLLDMGLDNYEIKRVLSPQKIYKYNLDKIYYKNESVELAPKDNTDLLIDVRLDYKLKFRDLELELPDINKETALACVDILKNGEVIKTVELYPTTEVEKNGFFKKMYLKFLDIFK